MSSLGRSLKKQAPLSPRSFRPRSTPLRRTYSNTSDRHGFDEPPDPFVLSGANTPTLEKTKTPESRSSRGSDVVSPIASPRLSSRHCTVPPINIEMPQSRRSTRVATSTPPEPLSARGDRAGGYFPFHEDAQARVQRTHPFKPESWASTHGEAKAGSYDDSKALNPNLTRSAASSSASPYTTTPVTSYIPSGVHDSLLPMGKYYPSNYEKRSQPQQQGMRPPPPPGVGTKSDSAVATRASTTCAPQSTRPESDVKKKLQQYQRDMIAQATLAMGSAHRNGKALVTTPTGMTLNTFPMRNQSFSGVAPSKPLSPRLLPLGSPGPVTPMELEAPGGSYLDRGRGVGDEDGRSRDDARSPPRTTRAY